MNYLYHPYLFNPLYWIMRWALNNDQLRYIFVYGGSSAAKTYSIAQRLSIEALEKEASTMVLRKFSVDIDDSVYADFKEVGENLKIAEIQKPIKHLIRFNTGPMVRFRGLDESEKLKGLKGFKYLYYNELSLFDKSDFDQGRKRLRGMAGQKIIADWNPIISTHWIKTEILDREEWIPLHLDQALLDSPTKFCQLNSTNSYVNINGRGNMLIIKTTYLDNYWVVGHPSGKQNVGFRDQHVIDDFEYDRIHSPNDYRIYGLGEWGLVRTGSEFWKAFNESVHTKTLPPYNAGNIHISVDNNVHPYITISIWQIDTVNKVFRQIHELPCRSPDNTAKKAAKKFSNWLEKINFTEMIFVYGDPSANKRSTEDDEGRSFFDKFLGELEQTWRVVNRVQLSAPEVSLSAAFINEIYEGSQNGWSIEINASCRVSIDDYCLTKEDADGRVAKTRIKDKEKGISYEPHGHFSDAKRYLIITVLKADFEAYKRKRKRLRGIAA